MHRAWPTDWCAQQASKKTLILSKMAKFCPTDVPRQFNADSVVVARSTISAFNRARVRSGQSRMGRARGAGGRRMTNIYSEYTIAQKRDCRWEVERSQESISFNELKEKGR